MNVASGAPTPWNPGDASEIRTEKVVTNHKNFTQEEADKLRVSAATRQRQAKVNRQAYKSLRSIEQSDASDQASFRGYQTTVARTTATKKKVDVNKANTLYNLTPQYAKMGYSLSAAHHEAEVRVSEYQALYSEVSKRW
ncbi:hypothetical protein [Leptolyngbya sp. NIES-2104]|uniref:hypothetical protein n=1 Tax=Leptolyngbya sp. NIES-2104 TaxID=1552121 RepID=UPI001CED41EC|nr:hypothetical protein [Leptolyngbya sp. NIES-2104]